MQKIKERFDEKFQNWQIGLPTDDLRQRKAEQEYVEHNRKFYQEVEEKGLS